MAKILVVDDDIELSQGIADQFKSLGYVTERCTTGEDALLLLKTFNYDLIILDWGLPGISGQEVCTTFRSCGGQTPILFLTGRREIEYLESSLSAGADDYLLKPFNVRELIARVKTLLKRRNGEYLHKLQIEDLILDTEKHSITVGETTVLLRAKEVNLLEFLIRNSNRIYTAEQLINSVWPVDSEISESSLRSWIKLLRDKLAMAGKPDLITTIPRIGYSIQKP